MKEGESSQSCDDLLEDNAQKLATSASMDKDAVLFANTAVSSTVVPGNDEEELDDPNGWSSQEGSTFTHSLSVDWGMTARSCTWKADRVSGRSLMAGTATWQQGASEVQALCSELEAERLSKAAVRYVGLLTASSALVVADIRVAEARAEAERQKEVEMAVAAVQFDTSHRTTSVASSGTSWKRSLQPLSLSRIKQQGTGRHGIGQLGTGMVSFRSEDALSQSLGLCAGSRGSSKICSWRGLVPSMATTMTGKNEARCSLPDVDEHYEGAGLSSFMMLGLHKDNPIFDEDAELEELIMSESIRQKTGTNPDPSSALGSRSGRISTGSHMTGSEADAQGNVMVHAWVQTRSELRALGARTARSHPKVHQRVRALTWMKRNLMP